MNSKAIPPSNLMKGSLYGIIGFFFMALFGIVTKVALENGSVIWVSFLAYLAGTTVLFPYIVYQGFPYLASLHYRYLIGRALFGCVASFLYTISINYIPIVNSTLLFNTAPLFIPLLAMLWLKAHIQKSVWIAVAIGFIGIIAIIKPTEAIFTQTGNLIGLASGISLAVAYLLMKVLTATDPGIRIIFYYLGLGTLIQLPLLLFAGGLPNQEVVGWALLSGAILATAQVALVNAYRYAEASQIGIYQYSTVVFVGILDWLIWRTDLNLRDLIGVLLVALAGIIIIRQSR